MGYNALLPLCVLGVLSYISELSLSDNPPYHCRIGGCKMTFYLEKNLDNHLWNHSKKNSVCDFEGCSQTFEDQLQLAKHSKLHYGKCK